MEGATVETLNEINRFNYVEGIEEVLDLIKGADFVALDATVETTGLLHPGETLSGKDVENCFGEWYDKIKDKELDYCLLEVGLALFKRNPENRDEFDAEVFNIPIFPAWVDKVNDENAPVPVQRNGPISSNSISKSSQMDEAGKKFVDLVGFSTSKSIYLGAPYMNRDVAERADKYMEENSSFMTSGKRTPINPCLVSELYEHLDEGSRKQIIEKLRGISKIFEGISTAGVPVVGHNLLIKMIMMYKDFVEYLPDTYPEYHDKISSMFEKIYDTKQLAEDMNGFYNISQEYDLGDRKLYNLFRTINLDWNKPKKDLNCKRMMDMDREPWTVLVSGRAQSYIEDAIKMCSGQVVERDKQSNSYVAGFDAMISGMVFLDLVHILELKKIDCWTYLPTVNGVDYYDWFMEGTTERFKNKIYKQPALTPKDKRGSLFQEMTQEKKKMRREAEKKRLAEEKERQEKKKIVVGVVPSHYRVDV